MKAHTLKEGGVSLFRHQPPAPAPGTVPSTKRVQLSAPHGSPGGRGTASARSAGLNEQAQGAGLCALGSAPLTDATETLRQSSPQLLHLADLLGRLRFNEIAHLGDTGPQQLPQTGPEQSADNG